MHRLTALLISLGLLLLLCSCTGSDIPPDYFGNQNDNLPELEWDLVTDPGSTISADEVDGEMLELDDALDARTPSSLPSGYHGIQGMYFTPVTPSGAGFRGLLSVRVTMGNPIPNEYDGVRLFLFHVDSQTTEATIMDSARGRTGNWVTFEIDALGHFVIAENLSIPRPGSVFTVSAFADLAQAQAGTLINFWAIPNNGTAPFAYEWNFGDGGTASGAQVTHTYNSPGIYNVSVTGTDASGNTAPAASTPIEITASPNPLTGLAITVTQDSADHRSFSYGATITGGTGPFSYSWDFDGDGTDDSSAAPPANFSFAAEGLYGGFLLVEDALGDNIAAEFVSDARLLVLETSDVLGSAPFDVSFTLTALGFAPGDPLEVVFDDGTTEPSPGATLNHTYSAPGTFNAYATGESTLLGTAYPLESAAVSIVVTQAPPRPVITSVDPPFAAIGEQVTIFGTNFGTRQDQDSVTLNQLALLIVSWSDTEIVVELVDGADDGDLRVNKELSSDPFPFTVVPRTPGPPSGGQT